MANAVDFHKQKEKQRISHVSKEAQEFTVDFVRDGRGLHFGFNGFGDLMGYYVRAASSNYLLAENRIGICGEVSLYISNPQEKSIHVIIDSTSEPSRRY